jgi:hypothetical protein
MLKPQSMTPRQFIFRLINSCATMAVVIVAAYAFGALDIGSAITFLLTGWVVGTAVLFYYYWRGNQEDKPEAHRPSPPA